MTNSSRHNKAQRPLKYSNAAFCNAIQVQIINASIKADENSALRSPVTDSSNRPTIPITNDAVISTEMAKKRSGPIVSKDLVLHRHIRRFEMDVMMAHELLQLQHALQQGVGRRLGRSGWSIYPIYQKCF